MSSWKVIVAPMLFGLGYAASMYLLESYGNPDHTKFVREAMASQALSMSKTFAG